MEAENIVLENDEMFSINENGEFCDIAGNLLTIEANNIEELTENYEKMINKIAELKLEQGKSNPPPFKFLKGKLIIDEKGTNIGIHTTDINEMKKVIKVLEKYYSCSLQKLQFSYMTRKEVKKGEGYYLQGLEYNEAYLRSPSFLLKCSKQDKDKIHELLDIKKRSDKWLWYPERLEQTKFYVEGKVKNEYPIFIISKGRFYRNKKYQPPKTAQYLESINVDYKIVVEPQEVDEYAKSISKNKIITLPNEYLNKNQGSIPVRNFVHHYNIDKDNIAYWILDDNINDYYWVDNNERYKVRDAFAFKFVEDLMNNYDNVYLAGHQYKMFCPPTDYRNVIQQNGRVFSSILIRTDIPSLKEEADIWRGRYNEDVDLSLRLLKQGLPTILSIVLTADKERTGGSGGNEEIYIEDNNHSGVAKTNALLEHHADCIEVVERYGRTHHKIKTEMFENNKYIRASDFTENKYNIIYK